MHLRGLGVLAVAGAAMALSATPALGATIKVGNDGACADAQHATIQAGVDAAAPGDRVQVCPGTYTEQVTIATDGVKLESQKPLEAIMQAPATMTGTKAIVRVSGAEDVEVEKFTIRGPGGGGCDSIRTGVKVEGGGSADIQFNHITAIRDQGQSGCQNGNAVLIGRQSESTTGSANVRFNIIDDFQKTGVVVDNAGSSAVVSMNKIQGAGEVGYIAQNGVQVSRGADATVHANTISDLVYTGPANAASSGILLTVSPGEVDVENNRLRNTDVGIYAITTGADVRIRDNDVADSTYDGIALVSADGTRVAKNESDDNLVGIGLYDTINARVEGNSAEGNTQDDCYDDNASANTWKKNVGDTSTPAGLCKPRGKN